MCLSQSLLETQALEPEHQARSKIIFIRYRVVRIFCLAFSRWRFNADSETQINKTSLNHAGNLPLLKSSCLSLAKLSLTPPFSETICYEDIKSLNKLFFLRRKIMKNISSEPAEMLSNLAIHQHADLLKGTQPKKQILWKHMVNGTQELFFPLWIHGKP